MNIFYEANTVSDSYIIKQMDQTAGITSKILQVIKGGQTLTAQDIQEQILQIKRSRISPLADHVLNAFETGRIVLVYSKTIKVTQSIPFIVAGVAGKSVGYVFVNSFGQFVKPKRGSEADTYFNIGMKDLYVLMEGAYIALEYYANPALFTKNTGLLKLCVQAYTQMFLRILNKEYALSLTPREYDQVSYCIARFFIETVWDLKNAELAPAYAFTTIPNANRMDFIEIQDAWESAQVTSIDQLIVFLREHFSRLEGLTIRFFTEYYMNMFKATAILGMDVLPYFLFTVCSAMIGSFIVNQPIVYDILKKVPKSNYLYPELAKII